MENTMKLPTVTLPKYSIHVPSSGEKVFYRPFVVKEEKVLLIALESGEYPMIAKAIKDIVNECTYGQLDVDEMPIFDLCYLFLNIRAKSVGETVEPNLVCQSCGCIYDYSFSKSQRRRHQQGRPTTCVKCLSLADQELLPQQMLCSKGKSET